MGIDSKSAVLLPLVLTLIPAGASAEPREPLDGLRSSTSAMLSRCRAIEESCMNVLVGCNESGALECYPTALRCPMWRTEADQIAGALEAALATAARTGEAQPDDVRICLALARVQQPGPRTSRLSHANAALARRAPRDWTPDDWFHSARLAARLLPSAMMGEMAPLLQHIAHAVREGCEAGRTAGGVPSKQCEDLVVELGVDALSLVPGVPVVLPPRVEAELVAALGEPSPNRVVVKPAELTIATPGPPSSIEREEATTGAAAIRRELVESGGWAQMTARRRIEERLSRLSRTPAMPPGDACAVAAELMQVADALRHVEATAWLAALAPLGDALRYGSEVLPRAEELADCPAPATFASALWIPLEGAANALANPYSGATTSRGRGPFLLSVEQAALRLLDQYWLVSPGQSGAHWTAAHKLARHMLGWPTEAPYAGMLFYGRRLAERGDATAAIEALQVALDRAGALGVDCVSQTPGDGRAADLRSVLNDVRRVVSSPDGTLSKRWRWLARCDGEREEFDTPVPPMKPTPVVRQPVKTNSLTPERCTMVYAARLPRVTASGLRWTRLGGPHCGEDRAWVTSEEATRRCLESGGRLPTVREMSELIRQTASWFWVIEAGRWLCSGTDGSLEPQLMCETWCTPMRRKAQ